MAVYEYRCRTCDEVFEQRRAMSEANSPAPCPRGHPDTVRLLSMFARTGASVGSGGGAIPTGGGGCCGGSCGCHG